MVRIAAAWVLLIAGTLLAAATASFVALVILTDRFPHGPFVEVVIVAAAIALVLVVASVWVRRGGPSKRGEVKPSITPPHTSRTSAKRSGRVLRRRWLLHPLRSAVALRPGTLRARQIGMLGRQAA